MNYSQDERALVNTWLGRLGEAAHLDLQLDDHGICGIGHTTGIDCVVELPHRADVVYLRAALLPWPGLHPELLTEHCLRGHFLGLQTGGASFAIDPAGEDLMLWRAQPVAALDEHRFCLAVLDFIEQAVRWRDELLRLDLERPAAPEPVEQSFTGTEILSMTKG